MSLRLRKPSWVPAYPSGAINSLDGGNLQMLTMQFLASRPPTLTRKRPLLAPPFESFPPASENCIY